MEHSGGSVKDRSDPSRCRRRRAQATAKVLVAVLACAPCTACSVNGNGLVVADVTNTSTATVVRVQAFGAQLRTRVDSAGATVGYSDYSYVFSRQSDIPSGRHWFSAPLPQGAQSISVAGLSVGVDVMTKPPEFGLTLGVAQHVLLAQVPADATVTQSVVFDINRPDLTRVHQSEGCAPC